MEIARFVSLIVFIDLEKSKTRKRSKRSQDINNASNFESLNLSKNVLHKDHYTFLKTWFETCKEKNDKKACIGIINWANLILYSDELEAIVKVLWSDLKRL